MVSRRIDSGFRRHLIETDKVLRAELFSAASQTAEILRAELQDAVSDWKHKPKFTAIVTLKPGLIQGTVGAKGQEATIFGYVDRGTKPHIIRPKVAKALKFQLNYSPRTQPIARAKTGTGRASGPTVFAKEVHHPGNKPRKFAETFSDILAIEFRRRTEDAIKRAIRRV